MITITCKNKNNEKIELDFSGFFVLTNYSSLRECANEVGTSKLQSAGEKLSSINTNKRIIQLEFIYTHADGIRDLIYNVFADEGTLVHAENGDIRIIDFIVESLAIANNGYLRFVTVSLIAPFPFFRSEKEKVTTMTGVTGGFEFDLEIIEDEFVVDEEVQSLIENIYNPTSIKTGMLIQLLAKNTVVNPSIKNLTNNEEFNISFTMLPNDLIEIDTKDNAKTITLIRDNIKSDIGNAAIFQDWLQLGAGDNVMQYDAQSGVDYLDVTIYNPTYYKGV